MDDDTDSRELFAERAAIMEFDGGMPRHRAEFYACVAAWRYCERTGATPPCRDDYRLLYPHFTAQTAREPSEISDDLTPKSAPCKS